ncbi:MAG: DUF427 domain-containing protein [Myxococcota bacterium]
MTQTVNSLGESINPNHKVSAEDSDAHVIIEVAGEVIADSRRTLLVYEGNYPARRYFPREDVRSETLERAPQVKHCPYKGDWSYLTIRAGGQTIENGAWTYHKVLEEFPRILDYVAFYDNKVTVRKVAD